MLGTSNPTRVYHRKKQRQNCAGQTITNTKISDGCQSVVSSEAHSSDRKDHIISEFAVEKSIIKSLLGKEDSRFEVTMRNGNNGPLDTCCLIDSWSSSKSNLDLESGRLKTSVEDFGECSSSGDLATKRLQDEKSERDICISILRKPRLYGNVSHLTASVSTQGVGVVSDNCYAWTCKVCKHSDSISKMIVCDNCEEAFHLSCFNSHFKKVPENEWFCESCMKKEAIVKEKPTGRVDGGSPLLSHGNAVRKSTSEDGSQGNASRQAKSEDEHEGNVNRESPAEDLSQGNVSRESTSENVSQGNVSRQSKSEDFSQGQTSREAILEDNAQGNDFLDSTSEDESQGSASREVKSEGNHCLDSISKDESRENASREVTAEDESQGTDCTGSTCEDESQDGMDSASEDEIGPISLMLKNTEPHTSNVRIGSKFQADVPDWTGPVIEEIDPVGEPLEISAADSLHDLECKRPPMISSIGNWLQCQEIIDFFAEGSEGTICGKWRRAPLFEVQTDDFECFHCILWDPYYADCAVPQEIDTVEVMKQLKYMDLLRTQLAGKRRKLDPSKTAYSQDLRNQK